MEAHPHSPGRDNHNPVSERAQGDAHFANGGECRDLGSVGRVGLEDRG